MIINLSVDDDDDDGVWVCAHLYIYTHTVLILYCRRDGVLHVHERMYYSVCKFKRTNIGRRDGRRGGARAKAATPRRAEVLPSERVQRRRRVAGALLQRCSKRLTRRRFGLRSLTSDFLISVAKVLPPARACKWQICRWHAR